MFLIGIGKADITAFERGSGMLGYAMNSHIALDVETPLFARAYIIQDLEKQEKIAIVNCEICFFTPLLTQSVLAYIHKHYPEIGISDKNLMLSATHTHCSPAGFSAHPIYNVPVPGFIQSNLDTLVKGIVEAILIADKNKVKGNIAIGKAKFDKDVPVSFNRAIDAYNENPEVQKLPFEKRILATDKEMILLHFISQEGMPLGSINWFGVHTTNLPNNFMKLCSDNKGFAADYLEQDYKKQNPNYVSAFANGAAGDVSARVKYNPKLPMQRGKYEGFYEDDLKSSKFNGQLQYAKAQEILNGNHQQIKGEEVDAVIQYLDFGAINILPEFNNGQSGAVTSPSAMGIPFLVGSIMDGPGMHPMIGKGASLVAEFVKLQDLNKAKNMKDKAAAAIHRKYKAQGKKHLAIEAGAKRLLGVRDLRDFFIPGFADPTIKYLKHFARLGLFDEHAWTPQILPVQIFRVGSIAFIAFPFEITTVASWRLKDTLKEKLKSSGIEEIILCPYSNSFNGYITTFEEYQVQAYEGGHCVFGQWSLNALQQVSSNLALQLLKNNKDRDIPLIEDKPISKDYLKRFAYKKKP
ncbi:MAG: neutral/alkaline non-lysosomal ceramidase N-terminal domain-containing protein [Chitinophagales bacterium]